MQTSFVFSPKEFEDKNWKRFQSLITSLGISDNTIESEYLPVAISYLKELIASMEGAVRTEHSVGQGYKFSNNIFQVQDEKNLANSLNDLLGEFTEGLSQEERKHFNMDGFYPYYTQQPLRILFVGREACWMSNKNYIETLLPDLRDGKVGSWSLNQYPFHKRQFYMAYGILVAARSPSYSFPEWKDVPWADTLANGIFAKESGSLDNSKLTSMSWAFMNLSKISNDTDDWRTDESRYRPYVDSHYEAIKEEVKQLKPDLIIGANVYDLVSILGYDEKNCDRENADCYFYPSPKEGVPPFLNCYHFSAIKSDRKCFYDAVASVLSKDDRLKNIVTNHKEW